MTSSNKVRRYLQHHKPHPSESSQTHLSATQLLVVDPTLSMTSMRKFRGKSQPSPLPSTLPIPQICLNHNDGEKSDPDGHVAVLDEFDQVLENEFKAPSVLRTLSLKQNDLHGHITVPANQGRSFSFSLDSSPNRRGKISREDDDEESMHLTATKTMRKGSSSKETFSRLFHSFTFRSATPPASKMPLARTDSQPSPCLACQHYPTLDFLPKSKKRPSIFGVLVAKLNTSTTIEVSSTRCSVCKRPLEKSLSNAESQPPSSSKTLRDSQPKHPISRTKRRRSLPSLFQTLMDSSSVQRRPSFCTMINSNLNDPKQLSPISPSSSSLTESEESIVNSLSLKRHPINQDDLSQLAIEKVRQRRCAYHITNHDCLLTHDNTRIHTFLSIYVCWERDWARRSSVNTVGLWREREREKVYYYLTLIHAYEDTLAASASLMSAARIDLLLLAREGGRESLASAVASENRNNDGNDILRV